MDQINKILVAIDFRQSSQSILKQAEEFAKMFNSQISLIHVLPDNLINEKVRVLVEKEAKEQLEELNKGVAENSISTDAPILVYGDYVESIVEEADKWGANLIIVGAGEKSDQDSTKLGSTADRMVRMSKKPVFVVKGTQGHEIKNVFCPVDFSKESKRALKSAIILSRLLEAKLMVFSVCPKFRSTYTLRRNSSFFNDYRFIEHKKEFFEFVENHDFSGVNYETEIILGEPEEEIIKAMLKYKTDLLLMGTTGKSGVNRLLMGSVTERVIKPVLCSFITFKNEDAISYDDSPKADKIEDQFDIAQELYNQGLYEEALIQFGMCLGKNDKHKAALTGIAKVYDKLGKADYAEKYKAMAEKAE